MQHNTDNQTRKYGDSASFDQGGEFPVLITEHPSRQYTCFVDNLIESNQDFRYTIHSLYSATEEDSVTIHLGTPGGSISAMQAFLHAKNNCKANVHIIATGEICSAGAIILCDADSYELDPFASILLHSASFGPGGKSIDVLDYSKFTHEQCKKMLEYYTVGVLSKAEIEDIVTNKKELWMTAKEFYSRMSRKSRCRAIAADMVEGSEIVTEESGTEVYVDLMYKAMEIDEQQQSKPKKKSSRVKKPAPCSNSCC